jgi:hypothetical protein
VFAQPGETHIRRLRVLSSERDALSLRLRMAGALSAVDLHPASLPRSAIACIQKLSDPLPGGLRLESGTRQAPREWQRAVAESVERVVRRAARPALGFVPINAEAVVFFDRAELLECFASDWLEGAAGMRWWWRSLFETADTPTALVRAWLEALEHAPFALARLANTGNAARFVGSLGLSDARLLLTGITRRFALRELAVAFDILLNESGAALPDRTAPGGQPVSSSANAPQSPPWRRWVIETEECKLEIGQMSLLATGLMLVRAPAAVRSKAFADEVVRWHRARTPTPAGEASQSSTPVSAIKRNATDGILSLESLSADKNEQNLRAPLGKAFEPAVQLPAGRDKSSNTQDRFNAIADASNELAPPRSSEREVQQLDSADPAAEPTTSAPLSHLERAETDKRSNLSLKPKRYATTTEARVESSLGLALERSMTRNPEILPPDQVWQAEPMLEAEIETRRGGIFYLMNLGVFRNRYGDLTTPAQPGIDLPIWDFIALAGKHLGAGEIFGTSGQLAAPNQQGCANSQLEAAQRAGSLRHDPVWSLLTRLSGRHEDDPPGKDFSPPESWRLPNDWLGPFEGGLIWHWEQSGDRLRVWHPEGFLVVDVPTEGGPDRQLTQETRTYLGVAGFEYCSASSPAEDHVFSGLERWLEWLMPYIRARLARALGLRGMRPEQLGEDLSAVLLENQARVLVTATHLDVFFSLEEHPIEIRLAGLDRDPGWVPAAGRYVTFHFE